MKENFYTDYLDMASSFLQKSQKMKVYCKKLGFIHNDKVYLPDRMSLLEKLHINLYHFNNNLSTFKKNLETLSLYDEYLLNDLEAYMFVPIKYNGFHGQSKENCLKDSGGLDGYCELFKLTREEAIEILDRQENDYKRALSFRVFQLDQNVTAHNVENFWANITVDYAELYAGKSEQLHTSTIKDLVDINQYVNMCETGKEIFFI